MKAIAGERKRMSAQVTKIPDFNAHEKTQNHEFSNMRRKGGASAPVALRDLGRSPGGCNGPGRLQKGPVLEEI